MQCRIAAKCALDISIRAGLFNSVAKSANLLRLNFSCHIQNSCKIFGFFLLIIMLVLIKRKPGASFLPYLFSQTLAPLLLDTPGNTTQPLNSFGGSRQPAGGMCSFLPIVAGRHVGQNRTYLFVRFESESALTCSAFSLQVTSTVSQQFFATVRRRRHRAWSARRPPGPGTEVPAAGGDRAPAAAATVTTPAVAAPFRRRWGRTSTGSTQFKFRVSGVGPPG